MKYRNATVARRLSIARRAIDNALANPQITAFLEEFGYSAEVLREGQELYQEAAQLENVKENSPGEDFDTTDRVRELLQEAMETYRMHREVAMVAFKHDREARESLGLDEERRNTLDGFYQQANRFYSYLVGNFSYLGPMARFKVTDDKLQEALRKLGVLHDTIVEKTREKADVLDLLRRRDIALEKMDDWVEDYLNIARVALRREGAMLRKLGFRVTKD